jgi:hypothetical protein
MKKIEFKSGIYVMEVTDRNIPAGSKVAIDYFAGYIMKFRKRPLGYSYQLTKDITKAYRWINFVACQSFYYEFVTNRICWYEKSDCRRFKAKEIKLDIKLKRKLKINKLNKLKPWYKKK